MARLVNLMVRCGADFSALTRATKRAQTSMTAMQKTGAALKSTMKALGATLSVAAIVGFGKACVDAASDLQEVQNVVDVTFGSMSGQIDSFSKNAITQFGLSETAAKRYTGTMGAMLKSMGLTEKEAANMSVSIAGLTGDMASFYNLSTEDTFTKIRSGISGETEPLKQLGINMSIANLEAFAMSKGITKAYRSMSQSEQALLRYNYLISATSDAQGDFSRTSNSWANQTRILSERFNQLKVALGQGLIQALTPVLVVINQLMAKLVALAQTFSAATAKIFGKQTVIASTNAETVSTAAEAQNDLASGISAAGEAAKKSLMGFDELNILQDKSNEGSGDSSGVSVPDTSLMEITEPEEVANPNPEPVNWAAITESINSFTKQFFEKVTTAITSINWKAVGEKVAGFFTGIDWAGITESVFTAIGAGFGALGSFLVGLLGDAWQSVKDHFGEWIKKSEEQGGDIVSGLLAGIIAGIVNIGVWIYDHIFKPFIDGFKEAFGIHSPSTVMAEQGGYIIEGLFSGISGAWDNVKEFFSTALSNVQKVFSDAWGAIKNTAMVIWNGITSTIKDCINGIIGAVNGMISGIVGGINLVGQALNALSFEIPEWVPVYGGKRLGLNVPQISAPQIPYLANGAVIPPNREFLAVLGDQSHGTNIEAPLATIEEAVSRASGSEEQLQLLRTQNELLMRILDKTGFYVDGKSMWSALAPYQRQAERAKGW